MISTKRMRGRVTVDCDYCHKPAQLVDSKIVYHGKSYGKIWYCEPCQAWVGVHRVSRRMVPLGRLANAQLRKIKVRAHAAFDPLWRGKMERDKCSKTKARDTAYAWLAIQLGIPVRRCHIGYFDERECQRVIDACAAIPRSKPKT